MLYGTQAVPRCFDLSRNKTTTVAAKIIPASGALGNSGTPILETKLAVTTPALGVHAVVTGLVDPANTAHPTDPETDQNAKLDPPDGVAVIVTPLPGAVHKTAEVPPGTLPVPPSHEKRTEPPWLETIVNEAQFVGMA